MNPLTAFTDFSSVALPTNENAMSRRYLRIIERWVPVGMSYYNEWPVRRNCGHFFGGVLWYGQETAMTISTLALCGRRSPSCPLRFSYICRSSNTMITCEY